MIPMKFKRSLLRSNVAANYKTCIIWLKSISAILDNYNFSQVGILKNRVLITHVWLSCNDCIPMKLDSNKKPKPKNPKLFLNPKNKTHFVNYNNSRLQLSSIYEVTCPMSHTWLVISRWKKMTKTAQIYGMAEIEGEAKKTPSVTFGLYFFPVVSVGEIRNIGAA